VSDTFYFVAFKGRDKFTLIVIDLAHCVSYERDEWHVVDEENFTTPEEAIAHARTLAIVNNLNYEPFESRYDKSLNEPAISLTSPQIRRKESESELNARFERVLNAAMQMNDEEKADLEEWKIQYVATGDCTTMEWFGWDSVIERLGIE
jgi:hypothetical protein